MIDQRRIQTITEDGSPAKERVKDADAAYSITDRMIRDNETTLFYNTKLRQMYDGNPPFSQAERRRKGMAWMANFNTRTAERVIDEATGAQWDMFATTPCFIEAKYRVEADRLLAERAAARVRERYTQTLRDWPDFNYHLKLRLQEMNKMSAGPVLWPDEWCWKSEAIKHDNLILPRRTKATTGGMRFALIRDTIDILKLFEAIEAEDAEANGWNVEHCRKVIQTAIKDDGKADPYQRGNHSGAWASSQDRMRNRDFSTTAQFDDVPVRQLLVTEMDGTVSHYIMYDTKSPTPTKKGDGVKYEFMFKMTSRFKSMRNAVHLLMYDIGDGYYYSIKSLLQRIYPTCDLENRSVCSLVNAMIMSGGLIAQPDASFNAEKLQFTNIGALTVLDANLKVLQSTSFSPPIDKSVIVRNILLDILDQNRGAPTNRDKGKQYESDREKAMEQQLKAHFAAIQSQWMYVQFDQWHKETFSRLMNPDYPENIDGYTEAKAFRDALLEDGIPAEMLDPEDWDITAVRAIGMGSVGERRQIMRVMLDTIGMRGPQAQRNIMRDHDSAYLPYNMVDRYNPPEEIKEVSWQDQMAESENVDMLHGDTRTVGDQDDPGIHVPKHFEVLAVILKQFKAAPQIAPQIIQPYGIAIQHIAQHVGRAARDPSKKAQVAGWTKTLKGFAALHKQMVAVANKLQQQQQKNAKQRQQVSESLQIGLADVEAKKEIRMRELDIEEEKMRRETASKNLDRQRKGDVAVETKLATAAAEIARKNKESEDEPTDRAT